ncbi:MAG: LysR family transcriptional regulator [Synergistaceae bacterium]|jgi:DNA-binding transcriptional LysR family regulator|nr:LysR family transcriptional regulator [Synergistaceae bacterium]
MGWNDNSTSYRTLRYIITVAEEGNISQAAQKLYLSQPSLSHCILKQEHELGITLFDRSRQPLRLTYAGERYVAAARKILSVREQLEKEMENIVKLRKGRVVVGVTRTHSAYFLPRVIPRFKALHPDVEIVLAEETISSLESMLIMDRAEIALLMTPAQNEQIFCEHLYNEKILLCLPEGHPLIEPFGKNGVDLVRLREEPLILYKKGMRVRKISDALFAEAGIQPRVELESQAAETILNLVSAGMGCAFLPASIVQHPGRSSRMACFTIGSPPLVSAFAFAWKRHSYPSWTAQEFMKATRDILHEGLFEQPIFPRHLSGELR